jgi:zona occludens toxin (predicted ATPase)
VIDGQIGDAPIEVHDRIALRAHNVVDQFLTTGHRAFRVIDELLLDASPVRDETLTLRRREGANVELADSLLAPE